MSPEEIEFLLLEDVDGCDLDEVVDEEGNWNIGQGDVVEGDDEQPTIRIVEDEANRR